MCPQTRFAKSNHATIAYQVTGKGPADLVYVPGWLSSVEHAWQHVPYANFLTNLGSFARLIRFDKRGTGMSDRNGDVPTPEQCMEDLGVVMDEVGSDRAVIYGASEGGFLSMMFAAAHPERTSGLVLCGCFGDFRAPDYPWRRSREEWEAWLSELEDHPESIFDANGAGPSASGDAHTREWFTDYIRYTVSPEAAYEFSQFMFEIDARDVLQRIQVPTLVLHARGDRWSSIENGRYLSERIPNATLVELPGGDHIDWAGNQDRIVGAVQEFLAGVQLGPPTERILTTVMITDIVASTATAARMGDEPWRHLLEQHDALIARQVRRCGGQIVKSTGDGFMVTFDSPTSAIHCAVAAEREVRSLGVRIRAGVHTGECEKHDDVLSGVALHIAARITDQAEADAVWTSRTVKDVVVGSGIRFVEQGSKQLKGVPGDWELYSVDPQSIAALG